MNTRLLLLSALAALAGVAARADTFVTITPTGSTAATVVDRWVIGAEQSGLGYIDGNSGFTGATGTNFFTLTGAAIPALGSPNGFTSYLPAAGAPTAQGSVGNELEPSNYSGLTYVAENLSLIGPLSFYAIHHTGTGDYLALIQPSVPTVSDQKPMSAPGNPLTPGASGYFGLSYASDNPGGWGAQLFYYLRTNSLNETVFGSLVPALVSGPTDRWNLGANRGFTDLAYTTTNVGFGFGPSQFYYLRLDPTTQTSFFGHLNPVTGVATDIQNLGGVYRTLVFTPTDVAFGANHFYSIRQPAQSQSITFAAIAAHTACDLPFSITLPTASSGLAVGVSITGPASLVGNVITLTGVTGTGTVTASQAGNINFNAATDVVRSFVVTACAPALLPQSISFSSIAARTACDAPFTLNPTATSGLGVTLTIAGPATLAGNVVTLTGATGTVTITASQDGNSTYDAAPNKTRTFAVTACAPVVAAQTIAFAAIADRGLCEDAFTVAPTASSGLPVVLTVISGPAIVTGNLVTVTGAGTVTLQATQAGNGNFASAPPVTQTFVAAKCEATITLDHLTKTYYGTPFNALDCVIATTTPAGLAVVITYNGSTNLPAAVGSYTVVATIVDPNYTGTATGTFVLSADERVAQTVSFGSTVLANRVLGDAPFTLNPTSSSGKPASLAVLSGPATVTGNTVTLTGVGTVVLEVSQAGDIATTLYAAQTQSFVVVAAVANTGAKVTGAAAEVAGDIRHANGNIYDQLLLTGASATVTADDGQVVRLSFIDLTDDIVQVEFSGAGALTLSLDNATGPAAPLNYNQPEVAYMRGHARIVVTGADATTNLSVFSVGRITAINQALFREEVAYDGWADLASITILSPSGTFGGLRAGNAAFSATQGLAGIAAPGVAFAGLVVLGDIAAADAAQPMLQLGSATDIRIAGGDMTQPGGQPIVVSGITALQFVGGSSSHGVLIDPQANAARFEQGGTDITAQIVTLP